MSVMRKRVTFCRATNAVMFTSAVISMRMAKVAPSGGTPDYSLTAMELPR
jgi:hypothetical protein